MKSIDLFCGAGGLSLGFQHAGYDPVFAIDNDKQAIQTYTSNFGEPGVTIECADVKHWSEYPDADVIIGGPPCQGFSPLGKNLGVADADLLNTLWSEFMGVVASVQPRAFLIENVPEIFISTQFGHYGALMDLHPKLGGYGWTHGVLQAADYGVPQRRKRGFILGVFGLPTVEWPPPPTHDEAEWRTVRDAIGDLPLAPEEAHMSWSRNIHPWSLERYEAIPEGGNRFDLAANRPDITPACWLDRKDGGSNDVMGRLWWDRPAYTIRTEFLKPEKGRYLHPVAHRSLTHREGARLQTFPDDFYFAGSKLSIAKQIGNAVPPLLAYHLASHVTKQLGRV